MFSESEKIDLMAKVHNRCIATRSGCLLWTGAVGQNGYGRIRIGTRLALPHRVVAHAMGLVPSIFGKSREVCILHLCDEPRCCQPGHLRAGSLSENMRDCAGKGRLGGRPRVSAARGGPKRIRKSYKTPVPGPGKDGKAPSARSRIRVGDDGKWHIPNK